MRKITYLKYSKLYHVNFNCLLNHSYVGNVFTLGTKTVLRSYIGVEVIY